jgi:GTP cyclohydrolase I
VFSKTVFDPSTDVTELVRTTPPQTNATGNYCTRGARFVSAAEVFDQDTVQEELVMLEAIDLRSRCAPHL